MVFDEIANTDFTDPKALVSIMQGYMQDGKFSRGKKEILAFASIVLVGNIDIQARLPHEKYYHLFEPLPDFLQVEAFIDRLHGYLPGWEISKIQPGSLAQDYGFITDYFCEIMHELRRKDVLGSLEDPVPVDGYFDRPGGDHRPRCPGGREDPLGPVEAHVSPRRGDGRPARRASFAGH